MPTAHTMKTYKSPAIHRTPLYRAKAAYQNMLRRCENRCGTEPGYKRVKLKMTLQEWLTWSLPHYKNFLKKFPNESPCAARFGDKGHYEIGNIKIISVAQNLKEHIGILVIRPDGKKLCGGCRKVKIAKGNFYRNRARVDGLASWCIECMKEINKRYQRKISRRRRRAAGSYKAGRAPDKSNGSDRH